MKKFVYTTDLHVGYQNTGGKLQPLHDAKAIEAVVKFISDFKPDTLIAGGDMLDCGPVSHWLKHKKMSIQNLDITKDAKLLQQLFLDKVGNISDRRYIIGNHEQWLAEAVEENPGLKTALSLDHVLDLKGWKVIPNGGYTKLGKLHFLHGDTLSNVKNVAAQALDRYHHSVLFGHFHTHQVATQYSMLDSNDIHMAWAVPGLCNRNPNYLEGRPNQWSKGFAWGYVQSNGNFNVYISIITDGSFVANGKVYSA